jgi:hypothetical protein
LIYKTGVKSADFFDIMLAAIISIEDLR